MKIINQFSFAISLMALGLLSCSLKPKKLALDSENPSFEYEMLREGCDKGDLIVKRVFTSDTTFVDHMRLKDSDVEYGKQEVKVVNGYWYKLTLGEYFPVFTSADKSLENINVIREFCGDNPNGINCFFYKLEEKQGDIYKYIASSKQPFANLADELYFDPNFGYVELVTGRTEFTANWECGKEIAKINSSNKAKFSDWLNQGLSAFE